MAKKQVKKPSASFADKAAKKANPSEEAVEAILPIWSSQQDRKRLFFDSGFNDNLEMTDASYKEWTSTATAREAIHVTMDASLETRFGFGIFSSAHGKEEPTYLYILSNRGKAVITGPDDISDKLKQRLEAAGAEYVSQGDKTVAADKVNTFAADAFIKNMAIRGNRYESVQSTIETLIHAFCSCEEPPRKFMEKLNDTEFVIKAGSTIGGFIAEAGNPANVMYTVDLNQPNVPQKNKVAYENDPVPVPAPKQAPRPANA